MSSNAAKAQIGFVVDSTADIPQEYVEKYGFEVVPLYVTLDGKTYKDGVDLSQAQLHAQLRGTESVPSTAAPNPNDYIQAFTRAAERADHIICITLSAGMSSSYQSANVARQSLPDHDITIVDSGTVAIVEGRIAIDAAQAAEAGADKAAVVARIERRKSQTFQVFTAATLKYLRRSGRVNMVSYMVGSALRIKPLFTFKNGRGESYGQAMSSDSAYIKIVNDAAARFGNTPVVAAIAHADAPQEAEKIRQRAEKKLNITDLIVSDVGPILVAHGGPGVAGLMCFPAEP